MIGFSTFERKGLHCYMSWVYASQKSNLPGRNIIFRFTGVEDRCS